MEITTPPDVLAVINPYDQKLVVELTVHTDEQVNGLLDKARASWELWRDTPLDDRVAIVRKGLNYFRDNSDAIARDITMQMGKPIAQSRGEVAGMIGRGEQSIIDAPRVLAADELPSEDGLVRRIEHEPLGVVFDIAAWNYPLLIAVNVVIPALLAGNVVLIKHSSRTPLSGQAFENAFADAPIQNLVTNLTIHHDQAARVIADPRVDYVAFTGSVAGGRQVYKSAATSRFIDVGLELGGKDPAYVASDADIEFTVPNVVEGAMYNAGQSCCAIERVYVHESVYDRFVSLATESVHRLQIGDPLDESTTLGPLVSRSALDILQRHVDDALKRGGRLITGGQTVANQIGNFYEPTLLIDTPQDALIMQEESFGPLLPIMKVSDDDAAIAMMNDTRFGLTASVWTSSQNLAERVARQVNAGTIFQNRCDYLDPSLPWTGYNDSGKGSSLSRYGFYQLTRRKSVHFRTRI